jgi:exosome complex component RRP45
LAGQKCWNVRADVHILNYDGGLIDVSCIAVVAALQHFRRPDVVVEGERVTVFTTEQRVPVPMAMLHHPYCVTITLFRDGTIPVVDATLLEQRIAEGDIVITANRQGEICQVAKLGGIPADAVLLLRCIELAEEKVREISAVVSEALAKDAEKRNLGGLLSELSAENER